MVAEEVIITLSGGAPWGFRLQGGAEHQKPLQVAKVRKRSKACRAGLHEGDELVSINESPCGGLSHAQAMTIIDSAPGTLHIRVRRTPAGFQSVVLLPRAPSPRIDKEYRAALRAISPSCPSRTQQPAVRQVHRGAIMSPTGTSMGRSGLTSPPCSEAYYGETDSDADVVAQERQRRQKRRSPSNSCPGKTGRGSPEGGETSEMSGYDSAPDPSFSGPEMLPGVARREVIYQPPPSTAWSSQTSTETSSMSADDQSPREDSGFQDLPTDLPAVPLVSPERAKEAMMLSSRRQLVPMVGPVDMPVDEELTVTYVDKAKQAKLGRGDTVQDKQVKEARTKCRTIASLLTDAPNPHSRGVLMFKKRRQRSKKYTLTSYGSVDEDMRQEEDSQEEDGMFPGSESEFDEDGFSAAPDPTWDSDYMDMLERRSASVVGHTEDAHGPGLTGTSGKGAQLFEQQRKRAEEHAKKAAIAQAQVQAQVQAQASAQLPVQMQMYSQMQPELQTETLAHAHVQALTQPAPQSQPQPQHPPMHVQPSPQPPPVAPKPQQKPREIPPPIQHLPTVPPTPVVAAQSLSVVTNGDVIASQGNVPLLAPEMAVAQVATMPVGPAVSTLTAPAPTPLPESAPGSVLNRTARPFAPGFISNRASTAPVVFRPSVAKKSPRPVSVAVVQPPYNAADEMAMSAVSYAPSMSAPYLAPAPVPHPAVIPTMAPVPIPMVPPSVPLVQPDSRVPMGPLSAPVSVVPATPMPAPMSMTTPMPTPMPVPAPMAVSAPMPVSAPVPPSPQLARISSSIENIQSASVGMPPAMPLMEPVAPVAQMAPVAATMAMPVPALAPAPVPAPDSVPVSATSADVAVPSSPAAVHQSRMRATTAGGRTGILQEARRRSSSRRMFHAPEDKSKNSPNPTLLSMVQNLDDTRTRHRYSDPVSYDYNEEEMEDADASGKVPPPVAPKPRVIPEATQIPQAEGKGAELFARRQSRMDQYVVDAPVSPTNPEPPQPPQPFTTNVRDPSPTQSLSSQWKYSPNVRAPPPIGYNPLLGPTFPMGPQRDNTRQSDPRAGRVGYGAQKEGIKALDFLRRQPYQLNSAMFGGSTTSLQPPSQPQRQYGQQQGYTLNAPRQIPVKAARVYEIKRFSTPTPMSAPTMTPKVIAPRSATTLGDRISRTNMTSPPPAPRSPPPAPVSAPKPVPVPVPVLVPAPAPAPSIYPPAAQTGGLPELPKISAAPVANVHPLPYTPSAPMSGLPYGGGLQAAKQFKSAPELSALPPLRPAPVQVPKPRFVATRVGIQPRVWRPGALP